MREIHEIQERLYEERRDWTEEQLLELYRSRADEARKRGLRVAPVPAPLPKRQTG
jgi:hypothetical protein